MIVPSGCEDFLRENPKGIISPDKFFNSESEAELLINGLQAGVGAGGDNGTDLGVVSRASMPQGPYDHAVNDGGVANSWRGKYSGIRDANLIISRVGKSNLSDEVQNKFVAQAKFYRAFFYFQLTTAWGDVPYWTEEINIDDVSLLGKTSATIIQDDMVADLASAINSGTLPTGRWNEIGGCLSVWAVRMLKAHYHMWRSEYSEARTELKAIIDNSSHYLLSNYGDIFRQGMDMNDELIWGDEYLLGVKNNNMHNRTHPNAASENVDAKAAFSEIGLWTRSALATVRRSHAVTYDDNDARKPYCVFDHYTFGDGSVANFNHVYMPKFMRSRVPVSDPLFLEPDADQQSSQPNRIMRLADTYLLLAEAELALDNTAEALLAINTVRSRANLPDLTTITLADIQQERAWELLGEGMGRKTDLIRWGILESTILGLPAAEIAAGADPQSIERAQAEAAQIAAYPGRHIYMPIPYDDIIKSKNLGGALTQNPLWE